MVRFLNTFFFSALLLSSIGIFAQPSNDTAASPLPIIPLQADVSCDSSTAFYVDFTNTTASSLTTVCHFNFDGYGSGGNEYSDSDQFFSWTATSIGLEFISDILGTGYPPSCTSGIAIYDSNLNKLDCTLGELGNPSVILYGWNLGDNLIIQVFNTHPAVSGMTFCLKEVTQNTNINTPYPITPNPPGTDCSSPFLSISFPDGSANLNVGQSRYYSWTATSLGLKFELFNNDSYINFGPDFLDIIPSLRVLNEFGDLIDKSENSTGIHAYYPDLHYDSLNLSGWAIGDDLILEIKNGFWTDVGDQLFPQFPHSQDALICLEEWNWDVVDTLYEYSFYNDFVNNNYWYKASEGDINPGPTGSISGSWNQHKPYLYNNNYPNELNNCARLLFSNTELEREWLLSPSFTLYNNDSYSLSIDVGLTDRHSSSTGNMHSLDEISLLASIDDGLTWSPIDTWNVNNQPSNIGETLTYDISYLAGNDVKFAFYASNGNVAHLSNFAFFLDNFKIENLTGLSVEEETIETLKVYPNPVDDILFIKSLNNINSVKIFDITGKLILEPKIYKEAINVSSLTANIYFVKIESYGYVTTKKLIKK